MRSGITILAGLLAGVVVAVGILAAFVFLGPDPVGLRPTPGPTVAATASLPPSLAPSASMAESASPSSAASAPVSPSAPSLAPSASGEASQTGFHVGQPAPPLVVAQLGGGTIDLSNRDAMAAALTKIVPRVTVAP